MKKAAIKYTKGESLEFIVFSAVCFLLLLIPSPSNKLAKYLADFLCIIGGIGALATSVFIFIKSNKKY